MESAHHREGNRQRVRTEGRWYKGIARLFNREQDRPATTSMQYFEAPIVIDNAAQQVLDNAT
jgi:hypothetical protein